MKYKDKIIKLGGIDIHGKISIGYASYLEDNDDSKYWYVDEEVFNIIDRLQKKVSN